MSIQVFEQDIQKFTSGIHKAVLDAIKKNQSDNHTFVDKLMKEVAKTSERDRERLDKIRANLSKRKTEESYQRALAYIQHHLEHGKRIHYTGCTTTTREYDNAVFGQVLHSFIVLSEITNNNRIYAILKTNKKALSFFLNPNTINIVKVYIETGYYDYDCIRNLKKNYFVTEDTDQKDDE